MCNLITTPIPPHGSRNQFKQWLQCEGHGTVGHTVDLVTVGLFTVDWVAVTLFTVDLATVRLFTACLVQSVQSVQSVVRYEDVHFTIANAYKCTPHALSLS